MICDVCTINPAVEKHHICYFPEVTTGVCEECHKRIHSGKYPELEKIYIKYTKGDANLFYKANEKIRRISSRLNRYRGRKGR